MQWWRSAISCLALALLVCTNVLRLAAAGAGDGGVVVITRENEATVGRAARLYNEAQRATREGDVTRSQQLLHASIAAFPELAGAYNNLAMLVAEHQGDHEQARQLLTRGLHVAEANADLDNVASIHNNLGYLARARGPQGVIYLLEALEHFDAAIQVDSAFVDALYNKASALLALGHIQQAEEFSMRVLELEPTHRGAHVDLGRIRFQQGQLEKAVWHQDRAILSSTTLAERLAAMNNKGIFLKENGFIFRSLEVHRKALVLAPEDPHALADTMTAQRLLCIWDGLDELEQRLVARTIPDLHDRNRHAQIALLPYDSTLLKLSDSFRRRLAVAYAHRFEQPSTLELLPFPWDENDRRMLQRPPRVLKVGYVSFDFRDHPMGHLTLGLMQQHTALGRHIQTFCYSFGPNRGCEWRRQFQQHCDVFRDVVELSDLQAAQQIAKDGVDVLVDLMGHTKGARVGIPALHPGRISVNYLGFPGTMGSSFMDWALVDRMVVPPEVAATRMTEQVAYLPHTYQTNLYDASLPVCNAGDHECLRGNRSIHGLPTAPDALVLCNFNTINKMERESFAVWMSVLRQTPQSVLWLLAPSGDDASRVQSELRRQAQAHGVLASRLIFAPRVDKQAHLTRLTLADLFLDSFVYTAHSTASDALWAHVPLLTLWGDSFPSRVAASLLQNALRFPELSPHSVKEYERVAVYLASHRHVLRRMRTELARQTPAAPLFDTKGATASVEAAFEAMHDVSSRLHPLASRNKTRFQLIIQPTRSAVGFTNQEAIDSRLHALVQRGIELQEAQEFGGAQRVYSRVLRANPYHLDAMHLLGVLFFQTGQLERAVKQLTSTVDAFPHVSWHHANLGVVYLALNKLELAEQELRWALQLNASNLEAMTKLTELYAHQEAFEELVNVYAAFGNTTFFSDQQNHRVSLEERERAYLSYSHALAKVGHSLTAIELLESAVQQYPTLFRLGYNLAALLNSQHEFQRGDTRQLATAAAESHQLFETRGRYIHKRPRPAHKVVVAIYCHEYGQSWWGQWGPSSLRGAGLGGSEEAVVFLSRELQQLGYWVEVYGNPPPQDVSSGTNDHSDDDGDVLWYPHYAYDPDDVSIDVFVAWRYHISLPLAPTARRKVFWVHDLPAEDAKQSVVLLQDVDTIFCLSQFHATQFPAALQHKIVVSGNALDPFYFADGVNHATRFVYGSAPNRGLLLLLRVWPRIREAVPSAELSVFYGFTPAFRSWGSAHMTNFSAWESETLQLLHHSPGVRYVGLVDHTRLAQEYAHAGFYLYPTTYAETSCVSLMKAMANGAIPITSRLPGSALPETCGDFDLGPRALQRNIEDDPEWLELWVRRVIDAVQDEEQVSALRRRMKRFARDQYRWERVALQWHHVFFAPSSHPPAS